MKNIFFYVSTFGPIGFMKAPGTLGTLISLPLVYILRANNLSSNWYGIIVCFAVIFSLWVITQALLCFKTKDPSEIILDELIGTLVTFSNVPINGITLFLGFVLFRFFDIVKPGPIAWVERHEGAFGIVADDMVAGAFANIVLLSGIYVYHWFFPL